MAKRFQLRRGTTAQTNAFTGALGEVTIDTDKNVVVVHDGATVGGFAGAAKATTDGNIAFLNRNNQLLAVAFSGGVLEAPTVRSSSGSMGVGTAPSSFGQARIAIGDSDTGIAQNGDGVLQLWSNNVPTFQTSADSDQFHARDFNALRPAFFVRAWVNFDGTTNPPSVRGSGNVSSVVRNSTGDYTVTFATPLAAANYSVSGSLKTQDNNQIAGNHATLNPYNYTAGSFRFTALVGDGVLADTKNCNVMVVR